jgi:hypothetical protein
VRGGTALAEERRRFDTAFYEDTGPGVLSLQAVNDDYDFKPIDPDWPPLYEYLQVRLESLRRWRYSWWQHWALCAQYILPYRYKWWVTPNNFNRGFPVNEAIVNETPTLAMEICAAGLLSGLMSPSRPWFRLDPAISSFEPDADARIWLDDTAERILAVFAGSNWYSAAAQMFRDVATFGTGPMIIYADREDVIRVYVPCAGEYLLQAGARLSVDTFYREFTYTVGQIVEFFGIENCPEEVRTLWEEAGSGIDREFVVVQAIEPNTDIKRRGGRSPLRPVSKTFAWRETYWLRGHMGTQPLSLRGFLEKPFMVTRWSTTSNDAYGRGPGMEALGGARQLQQMERRAGEYIEKGVRPPMGADVTLERKPASILPGDITYYNAQDGKNAFHPLYEINPQWLPAIEKSIERVEARSNRIFKTDIFMIISQMEGIQPKNEFELQQRIGEKIQVLGPMIENFEEEVAIGIQRTVSIMQRRDLLRPRPASLRGIPIKLTYTSFMKLAQLAAQTNAIERTYGVGGKLAEAAQISGRPSPLRVLNLDDSMRYYADKMGFPARLIYSPEEVARRDQAESQAAAANQAAQLAQPAVEAAQGLSEIPPSGGNSALGQLLGARGVTQ